MAKQLQPTVQFTETDTRVEDMHQTVETWISDLLRSTDEASASVAPHLPSTKVREIGPAEFGPVLASYLDDGLVLRCVDDSYRGTLC